MPETAEEIVLRCGQDIVQALIKIACEPEARPYRCRDLWNLIEVREQTIRSLAKNFEAELEQVDRDLEAAFGGGLR